MSRMTEPHAAEADAPTEARRHVGHTVRCLLWVAGALLLVAATAPVAAARWSHISRRRSRVEPFFVCGEHGRRHVHCDLISDPTRGVGKRGPLAPGAITAGPELQTSPELPGHGPEGGYAPDELRSAYALPSESAGSGETVAVVDAFNDPDAEADLKHYRSYFKLPECTTADGCFRKVNQTGSTTGLPSNNGEWTEEISLDLDMVSAVCPNCHILLVEARTEENSDLAAAVDEAVKLGATEVSNSYGTPELSEPELASAFDHPGIPITAAAGDDGYGVEWPAASPNVIAVGGTTLEPAANSRGWKESVWYETTGGERSGTGSGCSEEPKPSWQTDTGCRFRTNNDVAAVANPNTPVSVYDTYQTGGEPWLLLGGTSVATPIVASASALSSAHTRTLPGAKAFYVQATLNGTGTLNDVTIGRNGSCGNYLCEAEVGYDGPTGLGTLQGPPEVPLPTFTTDGASAISTTSATVSATVDPNGSELECTFEYGPTASLGSTAPCTHEPGSGTSAVTVTATLSGLTPGSGYHFRVAGSYPGGSGQGLESTFQTQEGGPVAVTEAASAIARTSAELNGTVDPDGAQVSECEFEYGPSTAYGSSVPCSSLPGSGHAAVPVAAAVSGLSAGHSYDFRLRAVSAKGTSYGVAREFTTLSAKPTATSEPASEETETAATLNALVNPNGVDVTTCQFEYGPTTAYGSTEPCTRSPGAGTSPVAVSASVEGLEADHTYHFRIRATNAEGSATGSDVEFKTLANPAPTVETRSATELHATSAKLNGSVDPEGARAIACEFQYGPTSSYGSSVKCSQSLAGLDTPTTVSAVVTGLEANSAYHFKLVVTAESSRSGGDETLRTLPNAPRILSSGTTGVGTDAGTLVASLETEGVALTSCEFQYGTSEEALEHSLPCESSGEPVAGTLDVSAGVEGLSPGSSYSYRVLAGDAGGSSYGPTQSFTTEHAGSLVTQLAPDGIEPPKPVTKPSVLPTAVTALSSATLVSSTRGAVVAKLRCAAHGASCKGTLTLERLAAKSASGKGRAGTLASIKFALATGQASDVKLHLSQATLRTLARVHAMRVRAVLQTDQPSGAVRTDQLLVTLEAKRSHRA